MRLGDLTVARLVKLPKTEKVLETCRARDYRSFFFVRTEISGGVETLVLKFDRNEKTRLSCQKLKDWDSQAIILPIEYAKKTVTKKRRRRSKQPA